jgi:hypothetical protein
MSTKLEEYDHAPEIEGTMVYRPDWYLLEMPKDFHAILVPLLEATGEAFKPAAWPHISVMKGEAPCRNQADWGSAFVGETVRVRYNPVINRENGLHFWIDCYSPRLCEMREHFGLPTLKRQDGTYLVNFHMTIARRKKTIAAHLRPQLRLSPQSHIDVETGMQHL